MPSFSSGLADVSDNEDDYVWGLRRTSATNSDASTDSLPSRWRNQSWAEKVVIALSFCVVWEQETEGVVDLDHFFPIRTMTWTLHDKHL